MAPAREWLSARRGRAGGWLILILAAAVTDCDDGGPLPEPAVELAPDGVAVSEPIVGPTTGTGSAAVQTAVTATEQGLVYVSATPGTFEEGVSATVTNLTTEESVPAEILDGGFDPVALAGASGDTLEILVRYASESLIAYRIVVPAEKPPRVVRTRPPKDAVDVPLNATVIVVFSEPVDPGTVTLDHLRLRLDGQPVAATLTLDGGGLQAELTPEQPLGPGTTYTLLVTTDVTDLTGDGLEEALAVSFQTVPVLSGQIVFVSAADSVGSQADIYVMNSDGSGLVNLTNHPAQDGGGAVSPDGTRILFWSNRAGSSGIYVMNVDGSGVVNLTNHPAGDWNGVWSPDGTKIVFVSRRDADMSVCAGDWTTAPPCPSDIFVMNADGSNPVNLTNRPTDKDSYPAWSPDGTRIAFTSNYAEPDSVPFSYYYDDIFVMDADGSNEIQLTTLDGPMLWAYWPTWSPDGAKIAFTGGPASGIWVMNADGSNPRRLTAGEDSVYCQGVWPSWSPDGSRIAFRGEEAVLTPWEGGFLVQCIPDEEVFVMNADGSSPANVTNRLGLYDWIGSPQAWSSLR